MSTVPHGPQVQKAIRALAKEVKTALTQLNRQAALLLAKGRYDKAELLVAKGREIGEFHTKVKVLREGWREVRRSGRSSPGEKDETTPLWEYYQPILETLNAMGGQAKGRDLEKQFQSRHVDKLKPGDTVLMAGNVPRWQRMIRKARKHLIKEGFIQSETNQYWRITGQGRKAAGAKAPHSQST